jgi:hypothetical protein
MAKSNCSDNKNPLQRSGTSQLQRLLPGLSAGYVQVDENGFDSWIVFAAQFGHYIRYYKLSGEESGNWAPFFNNDVSALLGSIAVQEVNIYKAEIKKRFDFLKDDDNQQETDALKRNFSELFAAVLGLAKAMDGYLLKIAAYNKANTADGSLQHFIGLETTMRNMVTTKLAPALQRLLGYYKAGTDIPLEYITGGAVNSWEILNRRVTAASSIIDGEGLSNDWCVFPAGTAEGDKNWPHYYNTVVQKDDSIYKAPGIDKNLAINSALPATVFKRINHAANHNLFSAVFDQFLLGFSRTINEAEKELLKTLGEWDNHTPHYALFLAFLKLFRHAQDSLNTLTQRHLDFYFKEVLQLLPQAAQPSHAHILVELAKQTSAWSLAKGEALRAGKDSSGAEILFGLDKEESFNKATVAALKSVYVGVDKDKHPVDAKKPLPEVINRGRLFASPVANSADGLGAALTSANKEWHPFANKLYTEAKLTDIAMPNAEIGFAVASHYLYLTGGKRKVMLRLVANGGHSSALASALNGNIKCWLTTAKGWYEVEQGIAVNFAKTEGQSTNDCAEISFTLPGDAPATVDYKAKVHGGVLGATTPVLKVVLKNDDAGPYVWGQAASILKTVTIAKTEIKVEVGMDSTNWNQDGLKALHLSNDTGPIDAAKPFAPFGAQPKKDTTFVIGHKEPFCKKNAKIKLHIEWGDLPAAAKNISFTPNANPPAVPITDNTADYPNAKPQFLGSGKWARHNSQNSPVPETVELFLLNGDSAVAQVTLFSTPQPIPNEAIMDYTDVDTPYGTHSNRGFMRLLLGKSFGHKEYLSVLSEHLIKKATTPSYTNAGPVEPYSPMLQSVCLSYSAHCTVHLTAPGSQTTKGGRQAQFEQRQAQFFHLYPFGEAEQHPYLLQAEAAPTDVYLLPQFAHLQGGRIDHQGEFYIGLQNLTPLQSVSLLFQVLEGSADPEVAKPENHVYWSYLGNNQWHDFNNQDISDSTRQLVQSGIITFALPANAGTEHTVLPTGHIWLRASVSEKPEAVCALLNVHAQAAPVTLQPNGNAEDLMSNALSAESINKLKVPVAAVKKITQPYPSFGGKGTETEAQFYVRVSERLRHKGRAITIWDYEHIVLQAFPQIHKAKCLNHTQMTENGAVSYNEVKPGHVTIITIPSLVNRNDVNPLKPYTNQSLLLEIKEYLQQRISGHVQLEVANPQFEEVRIGFKLQLAAGYTDFTYYSNQLKQEITAYLTPWAYNNQAEVQFGGKVYKSSLINFIEERPYVAYIADVVMHHIVGQTDNKLDVEEITASTARSILVSVQASAHVIDPAIPIGQDAIDDCRTAMAK